MEQKIQEIIDVIYQIGKNIDLAMIAFGEGNDDLGQFYVGQVKALEKVRDTLVNAVFESVVTS